MNESQFQAMHQLLERLVLALEQIALELPTTQDGLPALPTALTTANSPAAMTSVPLRTQAAASEPEVASWLCPIHGQSKVVPPGVSKRTGKPYGAFVACGYPGCNEKPDRSIPNHVRGYSQLP